METDRKTLVSIVGPTGIGKSLLAIGLAKFLNTSIISCDSCQFYRGMDIGTAKVLPHEQQGVVHHFLDILNPNEYYNAGQFESDAGRLLEQLFKEKDTVIMVGGSTLYAQALWYGLDEIPEIDIQIRELLNREYQENGLSFLLSELMEIDIETYHLIDKKNPIRVIRALEVYRTTGKPISFFRKKTPKQSPYYHLKFGLEIDRQILYERINNRVFDMIESGLLKETIQLLSMGFSPSLPAMQAIGYKEAVLFLTGKMNEAEMIDKICQHSRNYAKRQLTFFKKDKTIEWIDVSKGISASTEIISHKILIGS